MFTALADRLARLRTRYAEPHRAYHTQAHVDAMLAGLRALGDAVRHRDMVELAIWYHDAIYDPARGDNEARSAALLHAELDGLADPPLLRNAGLLVRATADHTIPPSLPDPLRDDATLFLGLDMAVLGADPAIYRAYERGIAAEYIPVHGKAPFHAGRARFLQATLAPALVPERAVPPPARRRGPAQHAGGHGRARIRSPMTAAPPGAGTHVDPSTTVVSLCRARDATRERTAAFRPARSHAVLLRWRPRHLPD